MVKTKFIIIVITVFQEKKVVMTLIDISDEYGNVHIPN